jgi:uncharacterized membrane protein
VHSLLAIMSFNLREWIDLVLRWVHVFAGILWVGTTYYFTWLDGRFAELERDLSTSSTGPQPEHQTTRSAQPNTPSFQHSTIPTPHSVTPPLVWMVHSGGFYRVEKQKAPQVMPEKLHWFKWEAALTWLSGLLLFMLVYYHGGLMVETEGARISPATAIALSLGLLAVGWLIYDLLWNSRLVAKEWVGIVICYALVVATTFGLFRFFSSRAACLQLGAIFGTIMAANVWMRILPTQRRMVAALKAGQEPDQAQARRAKARSKHNTFMVIPVVFLMLSPHFPGTYQWGTICVLVLIGWGAAAMVRRA